jgi:hypothetical protein
VGTSTPNLQAPNNTFESDIEMEEDIEYYVNSPDSDTETLNSEMEIDMIQELELEDSDIELTDYNSVSSTNNSPNSSLDTDPESIFDSFIPLIFILSTRISKINFIIAISLILIRILLSLLDISIIVDLVTHTSYIDPQSIIDMSLEEYQKWFDSTILSSDSDTDYDSDTTCVEKEKELPRVPTTNRNKPLPEIPLIDISITPFLFIRSPIIEKIIKDILKIIFQYLVNLITSIITSKFKSILTLGIVEVMSPLKKEIVAPSKKDKSEEDWDWNSDTSQEDEEYIYISAEQRRRLAQQLVQKDAHAKMKLTTRDKDGKVQEMTDQEPIFQDPWSLEPARYKDNSKLMMPWQVKSEHDEELASLAEQIIKRNRAKLETKNNLDLESNPDTESFYIIAPTPTSATTNSQYSDSTEMDYGTEIVRDRQNVFLTAEERLKINKPLPPLPDDDITMDSINKRIRMLEIILKDRESYTPTEDMELRTPLPVITPKTAHFTDFDFELESDGKTKPLINKPKKEVTYFKLTSNKGGEFILSPTTPRLKINKKNNKK